MEIFEQSHKFDWTNVTDDYGKLQQITGLAAASSMVIATVIVFLGGLSQENMWNIIITLGLMTLFTAVYYLFPRLYLKQSLAFLPSLVYTIGISSIMLNLGSIGDFFVIFLMLFLAINAFAQTRFVYIASFIEVVLAVTLVHATMGHLSLMHFHTEMLLQFFGIISFGLLLRYFARETISLREKSEELKDRAKQLLAQKNEIYLLINNISEGIIAVDTEKKITFINKGALKLLGIIGSTKKLVGKEFDTIVQTAADNGRISLVDLALEKKQTSLRDDIKLIRHDKTMRLHTAANPIIDENKKLGGAILLFRDITSETALDEQRAEFNAIASHELRTPLTVIEGYLYYLMTNKALKYDKKTGEFINKAYAAADGLIHLSNDILAVTKSDMNQIRLALDSVNLESLLNECAKSLESQAHEKKLKINVVAENIPNLVSDGTKIREVVTNLIENAIKFSDKGVIKVEAKNKSSKEILISVTDNGIGITREDQQMIFHKFYRTEDWQTRKTGGTGLGLYISKSYIARLGGKIGVKSSRGAGSTFWFSLPVVLKEGENKKKNKDQLDDFIKSL